MTLITRAPSLGIVMLLLLSGGCATSDPAAANDGREHRGIALGASNASADDEDVVVALDECPAAVQATILAHLDGGTIREIERTTDHGEVLYEVDVEGADGMVEFDVAEDGAFRGYEDDDGDEPAARADDDHDDGGAVGDDDDDDDDDDGGGGADDDDDDDD